MKRLIDNRKKHAKASHYSLILLFFMAAMFIMPANAAYQLALDPAVPVVNNTLTVTVLNNGTPESGILVHFSLNGGTPIFAVTDSQGKSKFVPQIPGTLNIYAGTMDWIPLVNVSVSVIALASMAVSPQTATLAVGGTQVFTATAQDQNGAVMAGIAIAFTISNTAVGNVAPAIATTDANGIATTTFTASSAGSATVTAANGAINGTAIVTVSDTAAPVINNVTLSTTTPVTGSSITVTLNATDNVGVTAVTANGVLLASAGLNLYNGSIVALAGTNSVNVSASDAAGNVAWDNASSYTAITPPGSISGYKINDINGNGKWDIGEKGISGWKIRLDGASINGNLIRKVIYTDATGFYKFNDLPAGSYIIREENRNGWKPTGATFKVIMLASGKNSMNNNFTNWLVKT